MSDEKVLVFYVPEFDDIVLIFFENGLLNTFGRTGILAPCDTVYILIGQL